MSFQTIWEQLCSRMDDMENQRNKDFAQLSDSNERQKYIRCFKNSYIYRSDLTGLGRTRVLNLFYIRFDLHP